MLGRYLIYTEPMPAPDASHWSLDYADPRSDTRFLFSIPTPMLRDLRVLAKSRDIGVSELLRRIVTREVAEFLEKRPDLQPSFRGQLPMPFRGSSKEDPGDCSPGPAG